MPKSISDTAHWVAFCRAMESERPDALFRDPFARLLAPANGSAPGSAMLSRFAADVVAIRTAVMDEIILKAVRDYQVDMVLNLAAGLDARAYRLPLPRDLRWIEVDLPEVLAYKSAILNGEAAACSLESTALNLLDPDRVQLLERLNGEANRILVLSEGLLVYLTPDDVAALAADLHRQQNFHYWLTDLMAPRSMRIMSAFACRQLAQANARLRFAPMDLRAFFGDLGWRAIELHPGLSEMRRLNRHTTVPASLLSILKIVRGNRLQSMDGTALFERSG
jgi:methyltransferase (TIGR00027 family)